MDPETIWITTHALERFLERKKGKIRRKSPEQRIRELLAQSRELVSFKLRGHDETSQYFLAGYWYFVVRNNCVITVFEVEREHIPELRPRRRKVKSPPQKWKWR